MKAKFLLLWLCLGLSRGLLAQNLQDRYNNAFDPLNKSYMTTNILRDKTINEINDDSTDGVHIRSYDFSDFRQLYLEMWNGAVDNSSMMHPDTLDSIAWDYGYRQQSIPLTIACFQFDKINADAIANNLIDTSNGQYFDVLPRSSSPYDLHRDIMGVALFSKYYVGAHNFVLPSSLFLTNTAMPDKIEVDFDDGD